MLIGDTYTHPEDCSPNTNLRINGGLSNRAIDQMRSRISSRTGALIVIELSAMYVKGLKLESISES